jgi:hypothetical protein
VPAGLSKERVIGDALAPEQPQAAAVYVLSAEDRARAEWLAKFLARVLYRDVASEEVTRAIRAAHGALSSTWIAIVISYLEQHVGRAEYARLKGRMPKRRLAKGRIRVGPSETLLVAEQALGVMRLMCRSAGVDLPEYIDAGAVRWLIAKYSPGRGGGRGRKLSPSAVRALLADPAKLAAALKRR